MHFAPKQRFLIRESDHSMRSPSDPFVIKSNKLLVLQINDFYIHFIPHNPYIYIYYIHFYVGLVSEKKNILQVEELKLGPSGIKIEA